MAKELPYFKYFPSEWVTGDITLCTMESQGLFMNICSYYWMKNCSMSLANAKQRFSKYESQLNQLIEFDIIKIDNEENIIINFLDNQMNEFINVAEKRAIAGAKGGKAKAKQLPKIAKAKLSYKDKDKDKDKDKIYRSFLHLKILIKENDKLIDLGYNQKQIDSVYDSIENYKQNKKYISLYLTAKKWLEKEPKKLKVPVPLSI